MRLGLAILRSRMWRQRSTALDSVVQRIEDGFDAADPLDFLLPVFGRVDYSIEAGLWSWRGFSPRSASVRAG